MRALTAAAPRLLSRLSRQHPNGFWLSATSCAQLLRPLRRHPAAAVLCLYSTKAPAKTAEVVSKRQADATLAAAKSKATYGIDTRAAAHLPRRHWTNHLSGHAQGDYPLHRRLLLLRRRSELHFRRQARFRNRQE
ncbi:hypothetical protein BBAD15_g8467 [Beauveria bassiana D1-5]|uniref:Uncharacterized protein n=1 Tax=Beauveria bassiana D1-5 TaxID=1245745 RepID=A0A0A2VIW5_BEABA|nr:hypothetical protein BBAD15_g8467 [Beauveria bassiana D1-5]